MNICLLILTLFGLISFSEKEPSILIEFKDLRANSSSSLPIGEKIRIRGFLYQSGNGSCILAETPNLKTCCLGSKANVDSQIFISKFLPDCPAGKAVQLEGVLLKKPLYNNEGEPTRLYELAETHMITDRSTPPILTAVLGCSILCLTLWMAARRSVKVKAKSLLNRGNRPA